MRAHAQLVLAAWGALALLTACERIEVPQSQTMPLVAAPSGAPSFLNGDPRRSVAHQGVRHIEFPAVAGPGRSFRERITTDGQGRYSIEPLDASSGTAAQWQTFELLQRGREGFLFRYRDFLVRDPGLFARNWRTTREQGTTNVAGRSCARFRVERTVGAPIVIELSVDEGTGLVLASEERDAGGQLVSRMTYESLQLDPDLGPVVWHVPANEERVLAPGLSFEDVEHEIGSVTLRPRLLPHGYDSLETATVVDGAGARWLKRTYSDGVEPLFFFQALAEDTGASRPRGVTPNAAHVDPTLASASSVVVFEVGAATAIQGKVDGFDVMVIGTVPQEELLDLIESSLP